MTLKQIPWAMTNSGAASNPAERARQAHQSHLGGAGVEYANALAVSSLGTPNMSVNVAPGGVWIPGTLGSLGAVNLTAQTTYGAPAYYTSQGSYYDYNDATVNLAIAAANATNPRIDLVVATVQDADYSGSSNQALLQVITGTPAASPVAPTPPASSLVLAQIAVAANATSITSGNITDTRPIAGSGAWGAWSAVIGTNITSVNLARSTKIGRTVIWRISFVATAAGNATFSLPYPALDTSHMFVAQAAGAFCPSWAQDTQHAIVTGITGTGTVVLATGTYEAAQ